MRSEALIYVPSDTPEAMVLATRRVAGVPLIVRGLMTVAEAGIRKVTLLVAPSQREVIERFLRRYRTTNLPTLVILTYDEPYRLSPALVETCLTHLDQRFFVINADLLFDTALVKTMRLPPLHGREILLCHEGAHPVPFSVVTHAGFATLRAFTEEKPRSVESCLAYLTTTLIPRVVQKPVETNAFLLKRPQNIPVAEKFLAETIRIATGGPVARYLNKRLSLPASLILSKLWVSPNTITAFNIIIGLLGGVFVADGHRYGVILLGATFYQLASVIDGCDGEVAKLTFRKSRFGQVIDTIGDNLALFGFMIGMIGGYWRHTHSLFTFVMGVALLTSVSLSFFMMLRSIARKSDSKSLVAYESEYLSRLPHVRYGSVLAFVNVMKYAVKKDGFSFLAFLFAVAGHLYWFLYLTTLGAIVAATIVTALSFAETTVEEERVSEAHVHVRTPSRSS